MVGAVVEFSPAEAEEVARLTAPLWDDGASRAQLVARYTLTVELGLEELERFLADAGEDGCR